MPLVKFPWIGLISAKISVAVEKAENLLGKFALKIHSHRYATKATRTALLAGKKEFALKDHTHSYIRKSELINGMYQVSNADTLSGRTDFSLKDHKHEFVEKGVDTTILNDAPSGSRTIIISNYQTGLIMIHNKVYFPTSQIKTAEGFVVTLDRGLESDVPKGTLGKILSVSSQAYLCSNEGELVPPQHMFATAVHDHNEYVYIGEKVNKARKLEGKLPSELAPVIHNHPYVTRQSQFKPKNAVAKKAKKISGRKVYVLSSVTKPAANNNTISTSVPIDLLEVSGLKEFPSYGYATNLTPRTTMEFYFDAYDALNLNMTSSGTTTYTISAPAIQFMEEAAQMLNLDIKLPTNLFQLTLYRKRFNHIVAKHSVDIGEIVSEVFFTLGKQMTNFSGFDNYTVNFQSKLLSLQANYYSSSRKDINLFVHFQPKIKGIAGNRIVVENRGFPYTLLVFTRPGGVKNADTYFSLSGR